MDINIKTSDNINTGFVRIPKRKGDSDASLGEVIKRVSSNSNKNTVMDAKAMLAKLKVENAKTARPKFSYFDTYVIPQKNNFEESVVNEARNVYRQMYDRALVESSINPINSENIDYYKNVINEFAPKAPLQLLQEVGFCKDPEELFVIIKKNVKDIAISKSDSKISSLLSSASLSGINSKLQKEFNLDAMLAARSYKKLTNLLTPRSKNPDVINLEKEAKSLGVKKVNYSDDVQNAKMVNEVLKELKELGIPIPDKITVSSFLTTGMLGCELTAPLKFKNETHVYLAHSKEIEIMNDLKSKSDMILTFLDKYKNSSPEIQERLREGFKNSIESPKSTNNSKHIIYHEFAHAFQPKKINDYLMRLSNEEMSIAGQISSYAKSFVSGLEAMPEMFAKLMDRQQLTPEQMKLYLKLGGIVPKFKP